MRVLHINKFGWPKGGSDVYMLRLSEELSQRDDVTVGMWAARPPKSNGVVTFDMTLPDFHAMKRPRERLAAVANVMWSRRAQRSLAAIVDEFRPDVAHLHLYAHQLSSSVLPLLHGRRIATVATAHDYKLVCPAYLANRGGEDCFACAKHLSTKLLTDRCLHGDRAWSAVAFAEAMLVRTAKLVPGVVIAPSAFMHERLADSWLAGQTELRLLRNPANPTGLRWDGGGGFLLYVGRLSPEKGVETLLRRTMKLGLPLVVAGDGPDRGRLEDVARLDKSVRFVGHVGRTALAELRAACRAQVIPSRCPEVMPLAALEAAVDGVPLLLAPRGGIPELLRLGARGVAIAGDDVDAWRKAIAALEAQRATYVDSELDGLRNEVGWFGHIGRIVELYEEAVERKRGGNAGRRDKELRGGTEAWT